MESLDSENNGFQNEQNKTEIDGWQTQKVNNHPGMC